jgi:protein melted
LILANSTAIHALSLLWRIAEQNTSVFHEYIGLLILTAQKNHSTICLIGQILSTIGQKNKQKAQIALEFIMDNLPNADRASQTVLLQEAVKLCSQFPVLFNEKLTAVIRQRNLSQHCLVLGQKPFNPQSSNGNVTIVNVNTSTSNLPSTKNAKNSTPMKSHVTINSSSASPIVSLNQSLNQNINTISNHQQYVVQPRRSKLIDSRSTGRLHNINNTSAHRSMSRLNGMNISNQGGLHMTRISSSQQINQASSTIDTIVDLVPSTIPPPLSQHVTIVGQNKYGIPSTKINKITSGGVTVNHNSTSVPKIRPFSQGPLENILKSSDGLSLNQSSGSITSTPFNHSNLVSVQQSVSSLLSGPIQSEQVRVVNSKTNTSAYNKSVTLLNVNNNVNHRMSVFEPSMRDTVQHFCEKHLDKIKKFMKNATQRLPSPAKCTIEERKGKKFAKLHFACQTRGSHCLYSKTLFSMRTRNARVWIHLMFLDLQSRSEHALSSFDSSVASLKHCWDTLKFDNRSFITLVTSAFPSVRDQEALKVELQHSGFFDVFDLSPDANDNLNHKWGCFL